MGVTGPYRGEWSVPGPSTPSSPCSLSHPESTSGPVSPAPGPLDPDPEPPSLPQSHTQG